MHSFVQGRGALRAAFAAVSLLALVAGASAQDTQPAPAGEAPAAAPAVEAPVKRDPAAVVATVNGKPITEADLTMAEQDMAQQFAQMPEEQRRAAALSAIMEIRLMAEKATTEGLDKDP